MESVSIIKCGRYQKDKVAEAIKKSADLLGGFEKFINPGETVLLKPNLLLAAEPDNAVTTHPIVLEAVIEILTGFTDASRIIIADSPGAGIPYTPESLKKVYLKTGIMDVAQRTGCVLNLDTGYRTVSLKDGKAIKRIEVIEPVLKSDKIINLCKFKTHNLTSMTGAVKNMFGIVPGISKLGYHLRFSDVQQFSRMLADIAYHFKPALNIMDGIWGMEGEGPGMRGTPRNVGLVLAGTDPMAVDMAAARLMGLDRELFPMLGLEGVLSFHELNILGEVEESYVIEGFVLPRTAGRKKLVKNKFLDRRIMPHIKNMVSAYPAEDREKCTLCGVCEGVCPQDAITLETNHIRFDYSRCIRCFCCSELCPQGAIGIGYRRLGRLFNKTIWSGKSEN